MISENFNKETISRPNSNHEEADEQSSPEQYKVPVQDPDGVFIFEGYDERSEITKVYAMFPDLEQIGSLDDYGKYLKQVYPEITLRNIFWHATDAEFSKFDPNYIKDIVQGCGFYFSTSILGQPKVPMAVVLDAQDPIFVNQYQYTEDYERKMAERGKTTRRWAGSLGGYF